MTKNKLEDLKAFYVYDDMAFSPLINGQEVTGDGIR